MPCRLLPLADVVPADVFPARQPFDAGERQTIVATQPLLRDPRYHDLAFAVDEDVAARTDDAPLPAVPALCRAGAQRTSEQRK